VRKAAALAQEKVKQRKLLVHAGDPPTLRNAVGIVTRLDEDGGQVSMSVEMLPVMEAQAVAQEIKTGRLKLAPRGTGTVVDGGVIQDDFQLESWDLAFPKKETP
jgi:hypothetical protein